MEKRQQLNKAAENVCQFSIHLKPHIAFSDKFTVTITEFLSPKTAIAPKHHLSSVCF